MRLLKIVPDNTNIDFVRLRYWAFGLTALLTLAAIALVPLKGLNLGVDFVGGLMIEDKFATPPDLDKVRSSVDRLGLGDAAVAAVGNADDAVDPPAACRRAPTRTRPTPR